MDNTIKKRGGVIKHKEVYAKIGISRDTLRKYNKIRNISWEIL